MKKLWKMPKNRSILCPEFLFYIQKNTQKDWDCTLSNLEIYFFFSFFFLFFLWHHSFFQNSRKMAENQHTATKHKMVRVHLFFFNKQSIFDPHPEKCLSFSKKSPQKIVWQLFSRWSINFYCLNIQAFWTSP